MIEQADTRWCAVHDSSAVSKCLRAPPWIHQGTVQAHDHHAACCALTIVSCLLNMLHDCIEHEGISSCAGCAAAGRTWEEERRCALDGKAASGQWVAISTPSASVDLAVSAPIAMGRRPKHIPHGSPGSTVTYKLLGKVTVVTAWPFVHIMTHLLGASPQGR